MKINPQTQQEQKEKKPITQFLTKSDFFAALRKRRYTYVDPEALQKIIDCATDDTVIGINTVTGSLKVLDAFELDGQKFKELTAINNKNK